MLVGETVQDVEVFHCLDCRGVWIPAPVFNRAVVETSLFEEIAARVPAALTHDEVRYAKCPRCAELMARKNFAGQSGIILDACRAHGVWCDGGETAQLAAYLRSGAADLDEAGNRGGGVPFPERPTREVPQDPGLVIGEILAGFLRRKG